MTTLEKIRAEIEAVGPKSHVQYGMRWTDSTLMIPFHKVLQIIDKYAEQEPTDENLHREREQAYMQGYEDASKRFRQEPCDDAISRQAVLEIQAKYAEHMGATKYWQMRDDIRALPPVRPQEQTGHWIKSKDGYMRCDQCGSRGSAIKARFCHHCGAKMVEPQESEEENDKRTER